MLKNIIYEVYDYLNGYRIIDNESEFSQLFLGRSECFLRTLRHQRRDVNLGVLAFCESRLRDAAHQLLPTPKYQHIGNHLLALSRKCGSVVNEDAIELDINA